MSGQDLGIAPPAQPTTPADGNRWSVGYPCSPVAPRSLRQTVSCNRWTDRPTRHARDPTGPGAGCCSEPKWRVDMSSAPIRHVEQPQKLPAASQLTVMAVIEVFHLPG